MEQEYYKTSASVEEYIQLAKDVNGGELIKKLKQYLSLNATLLEIGSGPGTDWKILNETYQVTGSDNSTEFLKHLNNKYPAGKFVALDAVTLNTNQRFDGIYANKVMHHLTDDELADSVKRQHEILSPDGVICLSFWEGEGSEVFKGMFVNYHKEDDLNAVFAPHFEVLLLEAYQEFEANDSLLLIAKRK